MRFKKVSKILGFTLFILIVAGGFFYGGFRFGSQRAVINITDSHELINADFSLFWDAVNIVKSRYVNVQDFKDQDFLYGAIQGVVGTVKDPYTTFFKPVDTQKFAQDLSGSFGGIGAQIGIKNDQLVVIAPLKDTPAEAAGLRPGDKILKINDTDSTGLPIDEAIKIIRGEPGTVVVFLISRDSWAAAKEIKITRAIINVPTLDYEMKPGKIAYLHLYNFNSNAPSLFYNKAFEALTHGAKGVVLDLRNNPGGFLDVSVNLAGWFLKRGDVVVRERYHASNEDKFYANGNEAMRNLPMVIIMNGGSASASEILAGALRDNRNIKIIGEKSFGKGTVQEIQNLKDGSSLKVSVAEWLTPNGTEINKKGLTPDIEVKALDENSTSTKDIQLEKALEILRAEL
ncbi:MAG: S41 family peptidase [Patescibacteria group bacterium]